MSKKIAAEIKKAMNEEEGRRFIIEAIKLQCKIKERDKYIEKLTEITKQAQQAKYDEIIAAKDAEIANLKNDIKVKDEQFEAHDRVRNLIIEQKNALSDQCMDTETKRYAIEQKLYKFQGRIADLSHTIGIFARIIEESNR
ncbi:hypothetical protein GW916_07355 [bacterium]|nr:hypothetical protein [bacterium]